MEAVANNDERMKRSTESVLIELGKLLEGAGDELLRRVAHAREGDGERGGRVEGFGRRSGVGGGGILLEERKKLSHGRRDRHVAWRLEDLATPAKGKGKAEWRNEVSTALVVHA